MSEKAPRHLSAQTLQRGRQRLVGLILDLKEQACLAELDAMLAKGWPAMELLNICIQGMQAVGRRFEEKRYFIAALIMAGEIMRQATAFLEPHFPREQAEQGLSTILMGTVAGDIHDLGKNLFAILARCNGFKVTDLGVEVAPRRFLDEALRMQPDLIGLSCVLTSTVPALKETIALLRRELSDPRPAIIAGGSCVDAHIGRHVQADFHTQDAAQGLRLCQAFIRNRTP